MFWLRRRENSKCVFFCGIKIDGVCFRSPLKFLRPIPPYMGATTNFPSFYVVDSVNEPQPCGALRIRIQIHACAYTYGIAHTESVMA